MKYILLLLIALVLGYVLLVNHGQEQNVQQHAAREQQIMQQQKQFMDQTHDLGSQMQRDLDNRMQNVDKRDQ